MTFFIGQFIGRNWISIHSALRAVLCLNLRSLPCNAIQSFCHFRHQFRRPQALPLRVVHTTPHSTPAIQRATHHRGACVVSRVATSLHQLLPLVSCRNTPLRSRRTSATLFLECCAKRLHLVACPEEVEAWTLAVSKDDRFLAAGTQKGSVNMWTLDGHKKVSVCSILLLVCYQSLLQSTLYDVLHWIAAHHNRDDLHRLNREIARFALPSSCGWCLVHSAPQVACTYLDGQ